MRFLYFFLITFLISCSPVLPIENPFDSTSESVSEIDDVSENKILKILILDVGQGDTTLVVGPSGKTVLIDGGPSGSGITTILPTLTSLGVTRLDWIVASHYDADHIGGIPEVLKGVDRIDGTDDDMIPTTGLLDRGDFSDKTTPIYSEYIEIAASYREEVTSGTQLELGNGAHAKVIVVNGHYSDDRLIHLNPDEENEASIGLLIEYGDFQYFTAGDLTGGGSPGGYETKDMETIAGEIIGNIDILHVGHHGSETSTNQLFLDLIKPESSIISVGKDNDYGHPTESVLRRLEDAGSTVYRTDLMGTLEIQTNGNGFEIAPR
jgi:beta-lactamase superfamily II metal-dependent hydrolase